MRSGNANVRGMFLFRVPVSLSPNPFSA
ncbi:hypothetical protein GGP44_002801 [Salinibacter ruber]|nr:hypothetical protein [Salinibacter ruber]